VPAANKHGKGQKTRSISPASGEPCRIGAISNEGRSYPFGNQACNGNKYVELGPGRNEEN